MTMEMQMTQEPEKHTPTPWRIHVFRTTLNSDGFKLALLCVGKSMTGRDWTAYIESEDRTTVLQTDGATEEEAIANAQLVLRAVNNHDALVEALRRAQRLVTLLTVRQVIEAGDDFIEAAGLNPWCMNEGLAQGGERIGTGFIDAALSSAQE